MEKAEIIRELAISSAILVGGFFAMVGFLFTVFRLAFPFKKAEQDKVEELKAMMIATRHRRVMDVHAAKMKLVHG